MVKHRAYEETRPEDKPRILVIATHGGPKERLDHIDEQTLRDEFGDLIVDAILWEKPTIIKVATGKTACYSMMVLMVGLL